MASEPQPSNVHEGASATNGDAGNDAPPLPTNAEDRKAAAAMSTLEGRGDDEAGKEVDADALGKAMKNLEVDGDKKGKVEQKVKVEAGDVALLVDQLELSKIRATELLKANEGDAVKAMTAFITASA